jgi:peptidoglycan/LPS O-acetylase OafA/YrhL
MNLKNSNFRDDINGLRAWAVVAVIFYHFGIRGFSGGFVGVDVFFVISGFLMTGIIVKGIEQSASGDKKNSFSILSFYFSRARRILPALIVLCCFVLLVGYFYLSKKEYFSLGAEVVSALSFFSNIKFWFDGGYFDVASNEKPLLHTWSLSVEWQFYIILPLILVSIKKYFPGRIPLVVMMAAGCLISLLLSIFVTPISPKSAFYLLPTRAWEMLAGGLVYLLADRQALSDRARRLIEGVGFALIIASIILFDSSDLWPGWRATIPVIGTVLILISARRGSIWTSNRPAQWLGDCSYSLYLWHWPFAVALTYSQQQNTTALIILCLVLTVLSGWASFRWVETPTGIFLNRAPKLQGAIAVLVAILFAVLPSLLIRWQDGVSGRLTPQANLIFDEADNKNPRISECHVKNTTRVPECVYGGNDLGVIVIGDSHAASLVRSVEKSLPDSNLHVLDWSLTSCSTVAGLKDSTNSRFRCNEFVDYAIKKQAAIKNHAPIIMINRYSVLFDAANELEDLGINVTPTKYLTKPYSTYSEALRSEMRDGIINTACEFAKTREVYMMRPIPEMKYNVPATMGRTLILKHEYERVSVSIEEYKKRNAFLLETQDIAAKRCGVKLLDPLPYLCSDGRCWGDTNGLPIYYDDDHMNERGGALLIPLFRQVFGKTTADR